MDVACVGDIVVCGSDDIDELVVPVDDVDVDNVGVV